MEVVGKQKKIVNKVQLTWTAGNIVLNFLENGTHNISTIIKD